MPKVPKITLHILQYLKEDMKDGLDSLPEDKRQWFLQSDTVISDVHGQACPNYLK